MSLPFCTVALPVPLRTTFTYSVPESLREIAQPGARVLVPFRNKAMVGVVVEFTDRAPEGAKIREITKALDRVPALTPKLIELGHWIANYYLAPVGEVFRAMLPPVIEMRTQRLIALTERGRNTVASLSGGELTHGLVHEEIEFLGKLAREKEPRPFASAAKLGVDAATLDRLRRQALIEIRETMLGRKAKTQRVFAAKTRTESAAANPDEKAARVQATLAERGPLPMPLLLKFASVSRALIERMLREGLLESWEERVDPAEDPFDVGYEAPAHELNAEQESAFGAIRARFELGEFGVLLLHGVTGSGKTEVYMRSVQETLARGKTAIVLVPEIALTLWVGRLARAKFGEGVAVLHSGLPEIERAREWWRVRRAEARVVVGTRSAVFAPVENLGLIIVDEEQESSYKQEDSPRYNGRDTAVYRARLEGAIALLGSATPSLESYHNTRAEKYRLLKLSSRVENRPLAEVRIVDLREEFRRQHRAAPVSEPLRAAVAKRLEEGTQAMVLINRRGYSWSLLCRSCGSLVGCQNCSIALTYHKSRQQLECHYCGYTIRPPKQCPKCRGEYMYFVGDGAERVEEYIREQFPRARIARLDRDTVRTKREYQQALGAFAKGEIDVLVGTQMVAKGHDFQRVTLVGVVAADLALGRPDFRAAERTFQLLTQVAGRAGRGQHSGEVLVETYYPEHYAIQYAVEQDYVSFYEKEAHFRRVLHYPPFTALASVLVRDRKVENAIRWSRALARYFTPFEKRGVKILGPAEAPLARLRREYRFQFVLKSPHRSALTLALTGCLDFCSSEDIPDTAVVVDVDPASLA
jgi:primosomal protein N' (replication factor Y)